MSKTCSAKETKPAHCLPSLVSYKNRPSDAVYPFPIRIYCVYRVSFKEIIITFVLRLLRAERIFFLAFRLVMLRRLLIVIIVYSGRFSRQPAAGLSVSESHQLPFLSF